VLYARDGSVVTPTTPGSASNLPRREVQNGEGTRTKILELYERVVEERDQLRLTLTAKESELVQLHQQLDKESALANDFEARLRTAEQARTELTNQNLDIAGRLTTAQIKRLEAEKKWLELSISLPTKTVAAVENSLAVPVAKPAVPTEHH
jgi:chromosome segregation ATPase